ncbi:S1 family peptidase [Sediminicola luteus]|uniref:Serine protease n=1 Tax=Sediminicola luteus TaxID=319238 RepID=A0A2A4G4X4_9FLAO|nr:serine protease [Sediminicola luteus]PCE63038.1 hypothetical protein B7P33_17345 [Sediminicola luteus]
MKRALVFLCILLGFSVLGWGQQKIDSVFVCDVRFTETRFNNPHAGSGFLLRYADTVYLCTAKHVLFFAKTDRMKGIGFGEELEAWRFVNRGSKRVVIRAGKLVNEDPNEKLDGMPIHDWLIFKAPDSLPKHVAVFELRKSPLKSGETLYFTGFPYTPIEMEPIRVRGSFLGFTKAGNLKLDVPKAKYNGCSGGPVFDVQGRLVGIVSMGYFNAETEAMVFEPASTDYVKKVLAAIEN